MGLEGRSAMEKDRQWKEKLKEKYEKEEKWDKRDGKVVWKQGKEKLHMKRKSKAVEKSKNPLYLHGLGLLNTKDLQSQLK